MHEYLPEYIAASIETEIGWLNELILTRSSQNKDGAKASAITEELQPRPLCASPYLDLVTKNKLTAHERAILILGMIPHLAPELMDAFSTTNPQTGKPFTEMGGRMAANGRYLLPTGETAVHLLAGHNIQERIGVARLFKQTGTLCRNNIAWLEEPQPGEPLLSGALTVPDEVIDFITTGQAQMPSFGTNFPAKVYTTQLTWDDMVYNYNTRMMVEEVKTWLTHHRTLLDNMGFGKRLGRGYKVLFHGPPGNGKTVTVALLGQFIGKEVLRIDLSMMVSKYIGETEKNLKKVFDRAERLDAILFFDEGDALFGKRTAVKDSHDRYANQQVSYLLQRIEDFPGITVIATNFRSNLDDAFSRRFQTMVHFPMPDKDERLVMWRKVFSEPVQLAPEVRFEELAEKYALSFAQIANVGAWCALMAIGRDNLLVDQALIRSGLGRELGKESRTL